MAQEQWGRSIRAFRKLKGYSQVRLAHELGISPACIGAIERGIRPPSDDLVAAICSVLNISIDELKNL